MKKISTQLALVTAVMGVLSAVPAQAAFDTAYNASDILMGFRTNTATGETRTVIFNLGASAMYRDTLVNIIDIGNVTAALESVYGIASGNATALFDRTNLFVGVAGANNGNPSNNSGSVLLGTDPNSTAYFGARRTSNLTTPGMAGSTAPNQPGAISSAATLIFAAGTVFSNQDSTVATTFDGIVNQAVSLANGWGTQTTGTTSVDFGFFNVERAFTVGTLANFGPVTGVENLIDLYRTPEFANGVNAPGTPGVGSYEGTFTIDSDGDVSFIVVVPEPTSAALLALSAGALGLVRRRRASLA